MNMNKILTVLLALAALSLTGCDNGGSGGKPELVEEPKNQSATITGLFDNNASATVKGTLTDSEWNGIANKIETALNVQFEGEGEGTKAVFKGVFTTRDVVIILEKNPASYANYKTTRDGDTMYINFGILNNTDALKTALRAATRCMSGNSTVPEIG